VTKGEALAEFREIVLPEVKRRFETDGRVDCVARAEAWNNYADALCEGRRITRHQCDAWSNPY
jgi:hypothetical protein